jgi:hypothetical protein
VPLGTIMMTRDEVSAGSGSEPSSLRACLCFRCARGCDQGGLPCLPHAEPSRPVSLAELNCSRFNRLKSPSGEAKYVVEDAFSPSVSYRSGLLCGLPLWPARHAASGCIGDSATKSAIIGFRNREPPIQRAMSPRQSAWLVSHFRRDSGPRKGAADCLLSPCHWLLHRGHLDPDVPPLSFPVKAPGRAVATRRDAARRGAVRCGAARTGQAVKRAKKPS